jgi:hypothetical protein
MAVAGNCPIPPFLCSVIALCGLSQEGSFKKTTSEGSLDGAKCKSPLLKLIVFSFPGMLVITLNVDTYHPFYIQLLTGVAGHTLGIGVILENQQ